jgi:hypothetical protein
LSTWEERRETKLFEKSKGPGWGGSLLSSSPFILERPGHAVSLSMVSERVHPQIQKEGIFRGILGQASGPAISLRPLRLPLFPQDRETEIAYRLVCKREPLLDTPDLAWDARHRAAEVTDVPP